MNDPPVSNTERRRDMIWQGAPRDFSNLPRNLFSALQAARRRFGGRTVILQDADGKSITYSGLILGAHALGRKLAKLTDRGENVGVLLPTVAPSIVALFALTAYGRTPTVLNFTAGAKFIKGACAAANIKTIVTSRRFVATAGLTKTIGDIETIAKVVYLEELRDALTFLDKGAALLYAHIPNLFRVRAKPDEPAVVLFTSGTTGAPKGVALSHRNILSNIAQCQAHVPFKREWAVFNVMPIFHAFGLVGGTLLPILGGMKAVLYPSPLDRELIPKAILSSGANVLIATDTFARLYARASDKTALQGLHYVILGAEPVVETTIEQVGAKSGARILEGYGVTECSPVVSVNHPDRPRQGTAGQLLPGMEARLVPAPGIKAGRRLLLRGPNVMLGYLDPTGGGVLRRNEGDWFDTGDLAEIDAEGYLTIKGRLKRFARVGAEMASLAAVEEHAKRLWQEANHAALAVTCADARETIILVTDQQDANRAEFATWARQSGVPQFEVPHEIMKVRQLSLLATGKPDYVQIRKLLERRNKNVAV